MAKIKILIAIDDPDMAKIIVRSLFNFINRENSEIILLNVLETKFVDELYFYDYPEKFIKHEARKANLAYVENLLEKKGFDYQFIFKEGDAAENIINTARDLDVSFIVMGSHNKKTFERFFLGSAAYKVSRQSKYPVMIVSSKYRIQKTKKKDFKILLAVDNSVSSLYAAQFLHEIIDVKKAKVYIINVTIHPQKVIPPETYAYIDVDAIIDESKRISEKLLANIEEMLKKHGFTHIKKISVMGSISSSIIKYAEENAVDLIVMGVGRKKGLSGLFLGSTSTKVSEMVEVPLLLYRSN